jgi:microcystin degradation protein MlrC
MLCHGDEAANGRPPPIAEPPRRPGHITVVKSTQHFYAGFAPIARKVLYLVGPGISNPDTLTLDYRHVEKPSWPRDHHAFATT